MVGLAFAVAASANFPALLLALTWKRFNTTGAIAGVVTGVVTSVGLVLIGPNPADPTAGLVTTDPIEIIPGVPLSQPAILSVPLGFLACYLGTVLSREETRAEREFEELHVRAETGLGAEAPLGAPGEQPPPPRTRRREPVAAMTEHQDRRT